MAKPAWQGGRAGYGHHEQHLHCNVERWSGQAHCPLVVEGHMRTVHTRTFVPFNLRLSLKLDELIIALESDPPPTAWRRRYLQAWKRWYERHVPAYTLAEGGARCCLRAGGTGRRSLVLDGQPS